MRTRVFITSVFLNIFFILTINAQKSIANLVASATPEATKAGELILKKGGNAIDAAVAVAFTLGVTEPAMSGIGGRTMLIVSIPNKPPIAIGGITLTPSVLESDIERKYLTYYKQISIPSQVKVLHYTWKKYGSGKLKWNELLQPAINYAENGFIVGMHRHHVFKLMEKKFIQSPYHNKELLVEGGIPANGDVVKQPTLAKTLKRIATHGANDFYKGQIAKDIAEDMANNGGWISYNDLVNFPEPKEHRPVHTTYRGYDVYSFMPPGGGWGVLLALNLLENEKLENINKYSFKRTKSLMKALNKAHNDRKDAPILDYINYQPEVNKKLSKEYAKDLFFKDNSSNETSEKDNEQGETTHVSIIDKNGVAVSMTSSVGGYLGSVTSTKKLGFFYNSYIKSIMGFGFGKRKPIQPNALIPSSMSPSLVRKNGKNVLVIGTPGSKRIVSTISQLIQLWIDGNESISEIIKYPRVHAINDEVYLEDQSLDAADLQKIRDDGFKVVFPSYDLTISGLNAYFGGVHAIEFKNGIWKAAADPRRDGTSTKN
ncbi:MAG: gamma-glutamyltransferase [Lutibacter sp.]|uniref:gamma-glutamyltransferase family protein n=1 Tax=Lutibacter sp. TaxID=1925666 RepID=UPI00385CF19A